MIEYRNRNLWFLERHSIAKRTRASAYSGHQLILILLKQIHSYSRSSPKQLRLCCASL